MTALMTLRLKFEKLGDHWCVTTDDLAKRCSGVGVTISDAIRSLADGFDLHREALRTPARKREKMLDFGIPVTKNEVQRAMDAGMMARSEMRHGRYYRGQGRNTEVAMWNEVSGRFHYVYADEGWGIKQGEASHPEDRVGLDGEEEQVHLLFAPLEMLNIDNPNLSLEESE
jgi:hypothetical protein